MIQIHSRAGDAQLAAKLTELWPAVMRRYEAGFVKIPELKHDWSAVTARVNSLPTGEPVFVVGIGGSNLGSRVVQQCLARPAQIGFLESPDPTAWQDFKRLKRRGHFVLVSKSGATLETLAWIEKLHAQGLELSRCTVVASPGEGALQQWAKRENVHTLWIPPNVGGRFSVLTAAAMLPAGLIGLDVDGFRQGAAWALQNLPLAVELASATLQSWQREEWVTQMWTYSEALGSFGAWWQQLWGESLGKKSDYSGKPAPRASTPMACQGPRDQHSVVQQLIDGAHDKFVFLNRVTGAEQETDKFKRQLFGGSPTSFGQILSAEAEAFARSLEDSGIGFTSLRIGELNENTLGGLFMLWQMTIALVAEAMQINAFDQPGVEIGKKYAQEILQRNERIT